MNKYVYKGITTQISKFALMTLLSIFLLAGCDGSDSGGSKEPSATPPPPVNQAPQIILDSTFTFNELTTITIPAAISDADGQIASVLWVQTNGPNVDFESDNAALGFVGPEVPAEGGVLTFNLTVTDDDGASATKSITVNVKNINQAPTVNAGIDLQVTELSSVTLEASASDSDGVISTINWQQTGGTAVSLSANNTLSLSFTAPDVKPNEVLTFVVSVTDDLGLSSTDTVNITVIHFNNPPIADAGSSSVVEEVTTLELIGSGKDSDGSIVAYSWSQVSGPAGTFLTSTSATAKFLVPEVSEDTEIELALSVTDDEGAVNTQSVLLLVTQVENLLTGQFFDSAVAGLTYSSETRVGITGADGQFHYLADETVVFGLGDLTFPAVAAAQIITPLEIAGVQDINTLFVVNMARLLQSLDQDCDATNGITIGGEVLLATTNMQIDFEAPDFDNYVADLIAIAAQVTGSCQELINAANAISHLQDTLDALADQNIPPIGGGLTGKLGLWEGVGQQTSISWTISILLTEEQQLIEYPSLNCGGYLTLIEETETQLLFQETLTFGLSRCVNLGYVELTDKSANELTFHYYWPTNSDNKRESLGAVGIVTKVE